MLQAITYMTYLFTVANTGPTETIPPNLHMLNDHAADFIENPSTGSWCLWWRAWC